MMIQLRDLGRKLVAVMCWIAICGVSGNARAAAEHSVAPAQTKIMFLFKEVGQAGIQAVENSLTRIFQQHGYTVLDRQTVAQALQRHAEVLQRYEGEVAKYFLSAAHRRQNHRAVQPTYTHSCGESHPGVSLPLRAHRHILGPHAQILQHQRCPS